MTFRERLRGVREIPQVARGAPREGPPSPRPVEDPVNLKSLLVTSAVALAVVVAYDRAKAGGGLKVRP